jgi:hypothetical protein
MERVINVGKKNLVKIFNLKVLLFEGIQYTLSVRPQPTLAEDKTLKKEDSESTSQSCTNMMKIMSQ